MIGIWADFWWLMWLLVRVKKADQFRCVSVSVVVLDCCTSWCQWRICLWREGRGATKGVGAAGFDDVERVAATV